MKNINVFVLGCLLVCCNAYQLTVYAVDSLFSYPPYNFTAKFEEYAGLTPGSVLLVPLGDGPLEEVILKPSISPVPDVVIGIDNVHQYNLAPNTFLSVNPPALSNIDPHLSARTTPFNVYPYEYGRITVIANTTRIGNKFDPTTLSLRSIISNPDILRNLILQDPTTSITGAAFFLATIAAFGDAQAGVVGAVTGAGDWRSWWSEALKYATVVSSWSDAWELFAKESYLVVSYELDPTYYICTSNQTDIIALDLEGDAWYLIMSLGVFNRSGNVPLAQQFVDWFLSDPIQSLIPNHEWMFPAKQNTTLPPCFEGRYTPPDPRFNERLNITTIQKYLNTWKSQWQQIQKNPGTTSTSAALRVVPTLLLFVMFILYMM